MGMSILNTNFHFQLVYKSFQLYARNIGYKQNSRSLWKHNGIQDTNAAENQYAEKIKNNATK